MKKQSPPTEQAKQAEATVTTTAKLTFRGVTHDMTLEELEQLYGVIGQALEKKRPSNELDAYKKALEEAAKHREKQPPLSWPPPHYVPPINLPDQRPYRGPNRPFEIWCHLDSSAVDPHIKLLRSSYPEQFPNG